MPWACCLWQGLFQLLTNDEHTHESKIPTFLCSGDGNLAMKKSQRSKMCQCKRHLKQTCPKSMHNQRPMNPLTPGWYPRVSQSTLPTKPRDDSNVVLQGFTMLHLVWHGFTIHSELKSSSEVLSQKCLKCGHSQTCGLNSYLFRGDMTLQFFVFKCIKLLRSLYLLGKESSDQRQENSFPSSFAVDLHEMSRWQQH